MRSQVRILPDAPVFPGFLSYLLYSKVTYRKQEGYSVDIASGLAAAAQAVIIARTIRDVDKAYDAVALKGQVVDLMDKLNDVRAALQDAQDELRAKETKIIALEELVDKRAATIVVGPYRYPESSEERGKPAGYPYCPRCDEVDHRMVHTVRNVGVRGAFCPQCKNVYTDAARYLESGQRA